MNREGGGEGGRLAAEMQALAIEPEEKILA
jgi:hypothetical protein